MSTTEKHEFQAEIAQLLHIVIHSLYTDKEIFIRELVSNAADATEKLQFLQASGRTLHEPDRSLTIRVETDEEAKTITITDAGVGMTRGELMDNLGTIAHSGSKAFLEQLKQNAGNPNLIGQFGVGFYSAFMVAGEVEVATRSFEPEESGHIWKSDGVGSYEITPAPGLPRGTKVTIGLRDEDLEFAKEWRVESIIRRYSNFVGFPIELNGKRVNTVSAIWLKSKAEVTDGDYAEFYKFLAHDTEAPRYRLHCTADAPLSIRALLFVPQKSMEKTGMPRMESDAHLYCRKILIQQHAKGLFPDWLRFLKGVVDSEDLPLNISREAMQDSALLQKLNQVLTKRFLKHLEDRSKADPDEYRGFFKEFGHFIKEGVVSDFTHRDALARLLRYETSSSGTPDGLSDIVARMPEGQTELYFLSGSSRAACEASPYYEALLVKGYETLFLFDPWDEFVAGHLGEFEGKKLVAAEKSDVSLENMQSTLDDDAARLLCNFIKESLGEAVDEVRVSRRLVGSPAVVVESDAGITSSMRRVLRNLNRDEAPPFRHHLEINPAHPVIAGIETIRTGKPDLAALIAGQVHDNALILAGLFEDPRPMLDRINQLMERLVVSD